MFLQYLSGDAALLHYDNVAGPHPDVLLELLALQDLFVVEKVPGVVLVDNGDLFLVGEILEAAGVDQGLEHARVHDQGILAGPVHFAVDQVLLALYRQDRDGDVGVVDVGLDLVADPFGEISGVSPEA